jgi:hypothetical protein
VSRCSLPAIFAILLVIACSSDQSRQGKVPPADGGDASLPSAARGSARERRIDGVTAPYRAVALDDGKLGESGTVEVIATWNELPAGAVRSPGLNACAAPSRPPVAFVISGKTSAETALLYAIVGLDGVSEGRPLPATEPVEVTLRGCRMEPVVAMAARPGAPLLITNLDERRHDVTVEHLGTGDGEPELLARLPMPLLGQRFQLPLARPGLVRVTTAADPSDHVYVAVSTHPYQAVPNARGVAVLEQVPQGTYALWVWHPPLERGGKPLVVRAQVKVEAGKTTSQTVAVGP